ncbi:Unknown protein [Striga hermonthica]|uniref:Reverse transcriptase zinc-binding domain-containing protein n=1 Tax=Striga hermonthica TaxID=68872 RepID=A0A9N7RGC1_STRHE|nr:Unknown protein [Striga hermonthica]
MRAIAHEWPNVVKGARWLVGNGRSARFWLDPWLGSLGPLSSIVVNVPPSEFCNATVAELVSGSGEWRWDLLHGLLPASILIRLAATLPPREMEDSNRLVWGFSPDGRFTMKSAYNSLLQSVNEPQLPLWKIIWRVMAPQRVRIFYGLLATSGCLPMLSEFGSIFQDEGCDFCGGREMILHVLRDCTFVKNLWKRLVPTGLGEDFFALPLRRWLTQNLAKSRLGSCSNWGGLFSVVTWRAWAWRNDRLCNGRSLGCEERRVEVLSRAASCRRAAEALAKAGAVMHRIVVRVTWNFCIIGLVVRIRVILQVTCCMRWVRCRGLLQRRWVALCLPMTLSREVIGELAANGSYPNSSSGRLQAAQLRSRMHSRMP